MDTRSFATLAATAVLSGIPVAYPPSAASPFAAADMTPSSSAHCDQLRAVTAGVDDTGSRIDFSVAGKLELVHSDGALIYLGVCGPPHPRVLCITYQDNGMKPGDVVVATGGYRRPDAEHILLDPCLAARRE